MKKDKKNKKIPGKSQYNWENAADIIGVAGPVQLDSAFIDTSLIVLPEPLEEFYPNLEVFERARADPRLPSSMFKISYISKPYPMLEISGF